MTDADNGSHIIVHLIDGDTHEISQFPTHLLDGEELPEAGLRIKDEQEDAQGKHFLVENIVESPKHGRHKEGN